MTSPTSYEARVEDTVSIGNSGTGLNSSARKVTS